MATFDDARKCPKCGQYGTESLKKSVANGTVHTFQCMNERCVWFETGWVVQVNSDGTIPERETGSGRQKEFPPLPGMTTERAEAEVEAIKDAT